MKRLIWGFALLSVGCASVQDRLNKDEQSKREFTVSAQWVSELKNQPLNKFRKINRFLPYDGGDVLIVGSPHRGLLGLNKEDGKQIWSLDLPYGVESAGVGIKDRFFVGTLGGEFVAVDIKTGAKIWSTHMSNEVTAEPLLSDGQIFVMAANTLFCLDAIDGRVVWVYQRPEISGLSVRGGPRPARVDNRVFAGFSDGYLLAFDVTKGNVLWETQLNRSKRFRDIDSNIAVAGKDLYVSGYDDKLYRIEQSTGAIRWNYDAGGFTAPLISDGTIFYSSSNGKVIAINEVDGKTLWTFPVKSGIGGTPVLYGSEIAVGESNGRVVFLNRTTGKLVGAFEPGRGVFSPLLVDEAQKRIFFISNESRAYLIRANWEKPVWFSEVLGKKESLNQ